MEIKEVKNPAVEKAVEEFNKAVTEQEYFALTAVWNLDSEGAQHSNYASGLIGYESFVWGLAQALCVSAQKFNCTPTELIADVTTRVEDIMYDDSAVTFEDALEEFKGLVDCYDRFRRDSIPNNKTFYSDFEEKAYNNYYAKTCEDYETEIGKAARKLAEFKEEI